MQKPVGRELEAAVQKPVSRELDAAVQRRSPHTGLVDRPE
jgi:hypothetical protein